MRGTHGGCVPECAAGRGGGALTGRRSIDHTGG